jgi:acyl-CoA synthetase (AMP-forming)/AMP-acid ligase II
MFVDFLFEVMESHPTAEAMIWRDDSFSYSWLRIRCRFWHQKVLAEGVEPGAVVALEADFTPNSVALFLVLTGHCCTLVPLTTSVEAKKPEFLEIAECEWRIHIGEQDHVRFERTGEVAEHGFYAELRKRGHPGLVLFSSGSTGKSKAAAHDLTFLLEKFHVPRQGQRTIPFLPYDHIGGVNTMLYTLSNGGCMVTVNDRRPEAVLAAIAAHRVELLPASPTFLNLILLSGAYENVDLRSLKLVTYGTEPMLESTLARFHELFPEVHLLQTYGLSEVGILRSKSRSSDSLWVKVGGEGFETRVVLGILHIRARSAMLGYLNAPSPFTDDGWFVTGDQVEVDGEYLRFLGRESEIINVGGEKVYPAEVESVIQEIEAVAEVTVFAEKNMILGNIVCARVTPADPKTDPKQLGNDIKKHCRERLEKYKVPVKIDVIEDLQHGDRFKKIRRLEPTKLLLLCARLFGTSGCSLVQRQDWRRASRESSKLAPAPADESRAVVQVYAARAARWRGYFAVHSWIAFKPAHAAAYQVVDVVGFRARRNNNRVVGMREEVPDRSWYGSVPDLIQDLRGEEAEAAIEHIVAAVDTYPYQSEYRVYPGPNSNTFVSYILRRVPELTVELPPHAIGKDWLESGGILAVTESGTGGQFSLLGAVGATVGLAEGVELNFLGMTFGLDILSPALKLPFVGRLGFPDRPW